MELVNKIIIILISLLRGMKNKYFKRNKKNYKKRVLILFSGIIGDSVCFLDSKDHYKEIFSQYSITYAFKPEVHKFYRACGIGKEDTVFELDFNRYCRDLKYYRLINKEISKVNYSYIVSPQKSISAAIVSLNLQGKEKISLNYSIKVKNKLYSLIYFLAFTKTVTTSKECTIIKGMNLILNHYSDDFIPACMPKIPTFNKELSSDLKKQKYCVICPTSSRFEKEWNLLNYTEIINNLIDLGFNIYLCGSEIEEDKIRELYRGVKNPKQIVNVLGKTNFNQWIEIIRNSYIVIGCDSASIHIAAATNTYSICILGGMDNNLIYPYKLDKIGENEYLPVCVTCDKLQCFGCRRISGKYGDKNYECTKLIKNKQSILCIKNITVEQVWHKIEEILKRKRGKK